MTDKKKPLPELTLEKATQLYQARLAVGHGALIRHFQEHYGVISQEAQSYIAKAIALRKQPIVLKAMEGFDDNTTTASLGRTAQDKADLQAAIVGAVTGPATASGPMDLPAAVFDTAEKGKAKHRLLYLFSKSYRDCVDVNAAFNQALADIQAESQADPRALPKLVLEYDPVELVTTCYDGDGLPTSGSGTPNE